MVSYLIDTVPVFPLPSLPSAQPSHLCSCFHPCQDLEAERLLGALQGGSREGRRDALRHLVLLASDLTFAREVINQDGLQRLGSIIEDGDE